MKKELMLNETGEDWISHPKSVVAFLNNNHVFFFSFFLLSRSRYSWTSSEIEEAEGASVLLAADVIYSDELTDSFFGILERLMSRGSEKVIIPGYYE